MKMILLLFFKNHQDISYCHIITKLYILCTAYLLYALFKIRPFSKLHAMACSYVLSCNGVQDVIYILVINANITEGRYVICTIPARQWKRQKTPKTYKKKPKNTKKSQKTPKRTPKNNKKANKVFKMQKNVLVHKITYVCLIFILPSNNEN